jgi:hypothetical protein
MRHDLEEDFRKWFKTMKEESGFKKCGWEPGVSRGIKNGESWLQTRGEKSNKKTWIESARREMFWLRFELGSSLETSLTKSEINLWGWRNTKFDNETNNS